MERIILRVMMVVPQYPYPVVGGLERQAHELAKALRELEIEVRVLSGKVALGQPSNDLVEGIPIRRIPWPRQKWLRFLRTPFDLLRHLVTQRKNYDVIHLHQHSWFGLLTISAAKLLGKPILTKLPNVGEFGLPGLASQRLGRLKLAILLRADALVAMSRQSLAELIQAGFPSGRILAVPNGIRLNGMRKTKAVGEATAAPPCRVVFVGRLSKEKALDVLLAAWRQVIHARTSNAILEIWGSGPLESELQQRCHEMGVAQSVRFLGHVDGVSDRLPEKDMFVLPSCAEGNSNAILEAMAAGLPIVSTDVGGTAMLVGKEGAEFLCRPGDSDVLAANLLRLIRDPALRLQIGSAMRRRVERHFDIHRVAETYASAYRLLVAGRRERIKDASHPVILEEPACAD
ncbi:MAG: glycosyltransferase family 4 protein [Kofleriaceae bacterium]|nr:glycosyltransferase family 4 protein [Candidatus Methylomirabilis lanthanidiphila]